MSSIDPYHYTPDGLELGVEGVSSFVQSKIEHMQHMRDHHEVYTNIAERANDEVLWTMKRLVEVLPEEIKGQVVTLLDLHAQLQFPLLGQRFALPFPRRRAYYEEVAS